MGDLAEALAAVPNKARGGCKVCDYDGEDRQAVWQAAHHTSNMAVNRLVTILRDHGVRIGREPVTRHRMEKHEPQDS